MEGIYDNFVTLPITKKIMEGRYLHYEKDEKIVTGDYDEKDCQRKK